MGTKKLVFRRALWNEHNKKVWGGVNPYDTDDLEHWTYTAEGEEVIPFSDECGWTTEHTFLIDLKWCEEVYEDGK